MPTKVAYKLVGHHREFCTTCPKETTFGEAYASSPVVSKQIRKYLGGTRIKICHVCEFSGRESFAEIIQPVPLLSKLITFVVNLNKKINVILYSPIWCRLGSQF
jgi:hypothetical protein